MKSLKSPKTLIATLIVAIAASFSFGVLAQSAAQSSQSREMNMTAAQAGAPEMTEGEVRKVDKTTKKITLKHGEIKNLDMPGMTMLFQVKDPAMLDAVKPGDKVRFRAEMAGGALVVTEIEVVK